MAGRGGILAALVLAGCVNAVPAVAPPAAEHLPAGYPPMIGTIAAELNGKPVAWETYDYSLGAFDASAQFTGAKAAPVFRMLGLPPGQPDATANRVTMGGAAANGAKAGPISAPLIEIVAGANWDGLRLSSSGQKAEIIVDAMVVKDAAHGHAKGHFSAVLCAANGMPIKVDSRHCQPFKGTFETDLQIDLN